MHTRRTIHLVDTEQLLDAISRTTLGVELEVIRAFNPRRAELLNLPPLCSPIVDS